MEKTIEEVEKLLLKNKDLATMVSQVHFENKDFSQIPVATLSIVLFAILDSVVQKDQEINKTQTLIEKIRDFLVPKYKKAYRARIKQRQALVPSLDIANKITVFLMTLYQSPRTQGAPDPKKREANEKLLQELYTQPIQGANLLPHQLLYWRLIALALLGDRPKPAELMVPYLRQKMELEQYIIVHTFLHKYIQQLTKVKKNLFTHQLDECNWRLTNLCLTIENETPNTTKFAFNYGAIGEDIFE